MQVLIVSSFLQIPEELDFLQNYNPHAPHFLTESDNHSHPENVSLHQ